MKSTGIVRRIDELGRIVIPSELRSTMDIKEKDAVEVFVEEDKIILKKHQPSCCFCENADELTYFKNKLICKHCIDALRAMV